MTRICRFVCLFWLVANVHAGILIYRSERGLEFADAVALAINGKDRALSLGNAPKLVGPPGKLAAVRLGGALLKSGESNTIALFGQEGNPVYLLPQGTPKNAPSDPAGMWKTARISYKKTPSDKTPAEVGAAAFIAFLPAGVEDVAGLCMDRGRLEFIGGKNSALKMQVELLAAAVKAYGANPAMGAVEKYVEQAMRQSYERFESGVAGVDALRQGLRFAELSMEAYREQPEQKRLRQTLTQRKEWLDRRIAILQAFAAAGHWDAFLLGYRDFEKYQTSFPEMAEKRAYALKQSLEAHRKTGKERMAEGDYAAAFRELRLASSRRPSDPALQKEVSVTWAEYSRKHAVDLQASRKQLGVGEREAITQALHFATRYKEQNKLNDALKSVTEAETIDPVSLPVLLKKAEILGGLGEFGKAIAALDEYDLRAVEQERQPAMQLRNEILFQLTTSLKDGKAQVQKAWSERKYHRVRELAANALRAKQDDPELLYYAGAASLAARRPEDSRLYLTRYLEVSNTLDGDAAQRVRAQRLLAFAGRSGRSDGGEPNWLSGAKLPNGVYYCPLSLAFQPRIARIEASNKLKVAFDWQGGRLKCIVPAFEKNERPTGEKTICFAYEERVPQVASVAYDTAPAAPSKTEPDLAFNGSSPVLLNNPYVDPGAVEALTGTNVALGFAGNPFFHPFVWEKIHYFRLSYDEAGRVARAQHLAEQNGAPDDLSIEFDWTGLRLAAVRGYRRQGADTGKRAQVYERKLQYQEGRLVAEEINAAGKISRIKYAYNGNTLVSATCEKDLSLDGRSRVVAFSGGNR